MKHKLPLSYVWNTYIYPIAIMVGAIVFGVYFGMVEGNKREQILAYAMGLVVTWSATFQVST